MKWLLGVSFFLWFDLLRRAFQILYVYFYRYSYKRELKSAQKVSYFFIHLKDELLLGPLHDKTLLAMESLQEPWNILLYHTIRYLRQSGCAMLPTLKRLEKLSLQQLNFLQQSQVGITQSYAQSCICIVMVPCVACMMPYILEDLSHHWVFWSWGCVVAFLLCCGGAIWMLHIGFKSRWLGMPQEQQNYLTLSFCAIEYLLAQIRSGQPLDAAWHEMQIFLKAFGTDLGMHWGGNLWSIENEPLIHTNKASKAEHIFMLAGLNLKKSIYLSLMEGSPCLERIERIGFDLHVQVQNQLNKEITLLGLKCLKPLFLLVAPAIVSLVGWGIFLVFKGFLNYDFL